MATPETMWSTPKVTVATACTGRRARRRQDAGEHAGPRPVLPADPAGAEPGAEDHHALEADVDHAGALGPQPAEAGQADRHGRRRARR